MTGNLYYWVADWNLTRAEAAAKLGSTVADMVDCTHGSLPEVAKTSIRRIAGYDTGTPDIRWTSADWAWASGSVHGARAVLHIDQSDSDTPSLAEVKYAKDTEAGASTIPVSIEVAGQRIDRGHDAVLYCDQAILGLVESAAGRARLPHGRIIAYQWASPTSNPNTILPGTTFTLAQANADLSVIMASFLPLPDEGPAGTFKAALEVDEHGHWSVHGTPSKVTLGGPDEWWEVKVGLNRSNGQWHASGLPIQR